MGAGAEGGVEVEGLHDVSGGDEGGPAEEEGAGQELPSAGDITMHLRCQVTFPLCKGCHVSDFKM